MAIPLERTLVTDHRFRFTRAFRVAALPFGVRPDNTHVEVLGTHLVAHFGPWSVSTPLANIAGATVTGPYSWPKVVGPAHLSLADRGLTFATNPDQGVCISFVKPVRGIGPVGWLRHPSLTVTVADPQRLVHELVGASDHVEEIERDERAALEGQTAAELRKLAREIGLTGTASLKKAELIDRILGDDDLAEEAQRVQAETLPETAA